LIVTDDEALEGLPIELDDHSGSMATNSAKISPEGPSRRAEHESTRKAGPRGSNPSQLTPDILDSPNRRDARKRNCHIDVKRHKALNARHRQGQVLVGDDQPGHAGDRSGTVRFDEDKEA